MVGSSSQPLDRDRRGAMRNVLKHMSHGPSGLCTGDPTNVIYLKRSTMDRSIVTVDRFDRTVTPKVCIKGGVLLMFKPFELEINLIDLSRHLPSRFS